MSFDKLLGYANTIFNYLEQYRNYQHSFRCSLAYEKTSLYNVPIISPSARLHTFKNSSPEDY